MSNIVYGNDPINHDQDKGNTNLFYNALKVYYIFKLWKLIAI